MSVRHQTQAQAPGVQRGVQQGVQGVQGVPDSYCVCGKPYSPPQFMIECDVCRDWFHGGCVGVKIYQSEDIDKYHCPKCAVTYGPSVYKMETNDHRHDRYEINASRKPMQSGSRAFITHLLSRVFPPDRHFIVMEPNNFTEAYLREKGFNKPLLFETAIGLDLKVPNAASFNIKSIERHCNSSQELDVIESYKQSNCKMTLEEYIEYFSDPERTKVLNVLSFEFSNTQMSMLVQPPLIARQLDWVRVVWPLGSPHHPPPFVQKYCIMSAAGAYTDFHIDFGGSTVWYHILHGQKVFYLIPPTPSNLALYQQWSSSANQSEVFFGDLVESCTPCTLQKGQTLFIPTGWIHAVFTPEDSLVFGGNFLHSLNIELQLQINEIEKLIDTPMMYRFPSFETIHWYAGAHFLQQLRRINEEQQDKDFTITDRGKEGHETPTRALLDLPSYLVHGVRVLADALKDWNARKSYDSSKKENIPNSINSGQLVRELARELRRLERLLPPATAIQVTAARKKKKRTKYQDTSLADERHFAVISETDESPSLIIKNSRGLYNNQHKKSIKLTLLKSVTHAPVDTNNLFTNSSQDSEDAELTNIASMACRSSMASYNPNYDSQDSFGGDDDDYRIPDDIKTKREDVYSDQSSSTDKGGTVLKIKIDSSSGYLKASPIHNQGPPPDYATTEHSILKTHLLSNQQSAQRHIKSSNQWTISKSQAKSTTNDSSDEQILFTNENLSMPGTSQISYSTSNVAYDANGVIYSPGMYNNENVHVETLPETYEPDYDVMERKKTLPDYSPTKSMAVSEKKSGNNFANNSDPYAQVTGSDSTGLSENEEYRLVQNNGKTVIIQKNVIAYANNDSYEYYDGNRVQDYQVMQGSKKRIKQDYQGDGRHSMMYDALTNSNSSAESHLSRPPPSYESSVSQVTRRTDRPSRRRVDHRSSIYDYEDLDEVHLCIDEDPRPPPTKKRKPKAQADKSGSKTSGQGQAFREVGRNSFAVPKNGIESLLQASAYTGSSDNQEREAVVGMLTIGQSYGLAKSDGSSKRIAHVEAPPIRAVHRDKDFVYTSLDMSSDDEEEIVTPRSRMPKRRMPLSTPSGDRTDREDESWSPRGRLGRLTPRLNRPSRRGSRREAVQAALRAARNRGHSSDDSHPPPSANRATSASPPPAPPPYSQTSIPVHNAPHRPVQPYTVIRKPSRKKRPMKPLRPTPFQANFSPTANKTTKFKKGMKTAKQRLGKILKIHKMIG